MSSAKRGRKLRAAHKAARKAERRYSAGVPLPQMPGHVLFRAIVRGLAEVVAPRAEAERARRPMVVQVEASREELQALGVLATEQPEELTQAACRVLGAKPSEELLR